MTVNPSLSSEKSTTGRSKTENDPRRTRSMAMIGAVVRGVDRVAPSLGAKVAARLFLTPRRARLPERERDWLRHARSEQFALSRFRLSGHRWSDVGKPVLLVHGWEGRGSQLGGLALALSQRGFQPISIDLPAHGSSAGAQTNLLEFAESVGSMVKHLGGVAGIVAHSFGAAATTVAMREGLRVDRLVYLAPSEDFDHFPRVFGEWLGLSRHLSDRMQRTIERRLGTPMADLRGAKIAASMRAPLLVIHDENDTDVPWKDGKTYSDVWPGAALMTTSGLGHRRILRDERVMRATAAFLGGDAIAGSPEDRAR